MSTASSFYFRNNKVNQILDRLSHLENLQHQHDRYAPVSQSIAQLEQQPSSSKHQDITGVSSIVEGAVPSDQHEVLRLLIQLTATCCSETVEVLQQGEAAWSHYCLVFRPGPIFVQEAEQLVRVAAAALEHPVMQEYTSTLRGRSERVVHAEGGRDGSAALPMRLKSVWLPLSVAFARAATCYAKQRPRQALMHAEQGIRMLQWSTNGASPELLTGMALRMVGGPSRRRRGGGGQEVSLLWGGGDGRREGADESGTEGTSAAVAPRSFAAQAIVSMVTSYAVYLYHCEKYEDALTFSELSCTLARSLLDELVVAAHGSALLQQQHQHPLRWAPNPATSSRFPSAAAESVAVQLLLSLCAFNTVMIQQGAVLADSTKLLRRGLLDRCAPERQKQLLDLAVHHSESVLGPAHAFSELVATLRQSVAAGRDRPAAMGHSGTGFVDRLRGEAAVPVGGGKGRRTQSAARPPNPSAPPRRGVRPAPPHQRQASLNETSWIQSLW